MYNYRNNVLPASSFYTAMVVILHSLKNCTLKTNYKRLYEIILKSFTSDILFIFKSNNISLEGISYYAQKLNVISDYYLRLILSSKSSYNFIRRCELKSLKFILSSKAEA